MQVTYTQTESGVRVGVLSLVMKSEGTGRSAFWPFPAFPNPLDAGHKRPKFNPSNHEDAPL